ncbi:hypothetical protein [Spiroplasma chinense]|nr:hypothetical protein [Spiroplasma chinense]
MAYRRKYDYRIRRYRRGMKIPGKPGLWLIITMSILGAAFIFSSLLQFWNKTASNIGLMICVGFLVIWLIFYVFFYIRQMIINAKAKNEY